MNRWPWILLAIGVAIALGLGASSALFFAGRIPAAIAGLLVIVWVFRAALGENPVDARVDMSSVLVLIALIIAVALATGAMTKQWDLNPQGQWDAWSIWNLRAKFLTEPVLASRAWSPLLTETHPEYPLLVSGAVAITGSPITVGYLFFLSLVTTVTGGIGIARGPLAGLIAGLTLASTGALLHEVPSQYADVPLAAYLAGALVLILIDRPIWAGIFAGFAAWTKDEGALFCVALVAALAIFRRHQLLRVFLGMLPGALIFVGFRLFLAPHVSEQFGAGTFARLMDAGRWSVVIGGVATQLVSLGAGWFHPIYVIAAFAIGTRFVDRGSWSDALFCTVLATAILAGYCITMVTTSRDITWQVTTAAGRLVVQWWPLAVIAMITWLRPAEESRHVPESPPEPSSAKKKTKAR